MDILTLEGYYLEHKKTYKKLQKDMNEKLTGRLCDHKVYIVNLIQNFMAKCHTYLEIGSHNGLSMSYATYKTDLKKGIGIDLFQKNYEDVLDINTTIENVNKYNKKCVVNFIKGNSQHIETINQVNDDLGDEKVDLLLIDGSKYYDETFNDFDNYIQFVRKDGFIVVSNSEPRYPYLFKLFFSRKNPVKVDIIGVYKKNMLIIKKVD